MDKVDKRNMPSKWQIHKYWSLILWDMPDNVKTCWACGFEGYIHRAHIKARCCGGSDDVNNMILICSDCHKLQEVVCDTEQGRKEFVESLMDGAPYMTKRIRDLQNRFDNLPKNIQDQIIERFMTS